MSVKVLMCGLALGIPGLCPTASAQERGADRAIDTMRAEADYLRARLARVNAEIALASYIEQNFEPELATLRGVVALADSDVKRAEDRHDWSERMLKKGFIAAAAHTADVMNLKSSRSSAEEARTELAELEGFILEETPQELRSAVEKSKSAEAVKKSAYERAQARRDD
jgi:hypothetical protein